MPPMVAAFPHWGGPPRPAGYDDVLDEGEAPPVAGSALPHDGGLVPGGGRDGAVEAVVRDVDPPADEPLRERRVPLEDALPGTNPVEGPGFLRPEPFRVLRRGSIKAVVRDPGSSPKLL